MNLFNLIDNNVISRLVIVEQNGLLEPMVPYEVKNHIEYTLRHNSEKVGHITRLAIQTLRINYPSWYCWLLVKK